MPTPAVVGIDLGTTFSLAAFLENGRPVVVRDESGTALVPSVISFFEDGTVLVGSAARQRALRDPEHTIFNFHAPPYGSKLDYAPALNEDLTYKSGGQALRPVGSTSVRDSI